ncbi:putative glutathione transferase [Helianthus anomalus]
MAFFSHYCGYENNGKNRIQLSTDFSQRISLTFPSGSLAGKYYYFCIPAIFKAIVSHGEKQAVAEAHETLQFLENELKVKGSKFFGGDNINLVDISATFIALWVGAAEEALGLELLPRDKFPKIKEWCDNYLNCQAVKDGLPPRELPVGFFKSRFGKA